MKCVDDFRLKLGGRELVPIVIGGMGVDISTVDLALEAARLLPEVSVTATGPAVASDWQSLPCRSNVAAIAGS